MVLLLLSALSPLIPVISGSRKGHKLLILYAWLSMAADLSTMFWKRVVHFPNSVSGNVFALAEFVILIFFYKHKVFLRNTLCAFILAGGILAFLASTTFYGGWSKLNRPGICVFLVVYLCFSLYGFYAILRQQKILFLEKSSFFWANVAILIYASGAFFLFLSTSHIRSSEDRIALTQLWGTLFLALNILKNILLGIALSKKEGS